jgi:hypothetical protein
VVFDSGGALIFLEVTVQAEAFDGQFCGFLMMTAIMLVVDWVAFSACLCVTQRGEE